MARAGADDVFSVGPVEIVLPAVQRFAAEIKQRCDLELQWSKTVLYSRTGGLPDGAPPGLKLAGETGEDGIFHPGLKVYGVPVGSPEYVTMQLKKKAKEIMQDAQKAREVLAPNRQGLWASLRLSISQRFHYLLGLVPPSLTQPVAEELDTALWKLFEDTVGFSVPRKGGPVQGGLILQVPEVPALDGTTYQECLVRAPVCQYGWGFRSLKDTCGPAYLGTLETAIPYMAGLGNICPQLAEVWGGRECWGAGADKEKRWRAVLQSGCSEGVELACTWRKLKLEASTASHFLSQDLPLLFETSEEGVGGDSTSGETRSRLVKALESLKVKALGKVLEKVRPKSTREAWAWRQRDKVSSAWILALPGYQTRLDSAEFSLAAATYLCIPPKVCLERAGLPPWSVYRQMVGIPTISRIRYFYQGVVVRTKHSSS